MFGRRKKRAAKALKNAKAVKGVNVQQAAGVAAERASRAARHAGRAAAPVMRKGAHSAAGTLSEAAARSAEILAETAEKLASSETSNHARERFAESAEALAGVVRPKSKHRVRKALKIGIVLAGVFTLVGQRRRLMAKLGGHHEPEPEPEPITLPSAPKASRKRAAEDEKAASNGHTNAEEATASPAESSGESN